MRTTITAASLQLATMVGTNPAIAALRGELDRLAGTTQPVLVTGPAGSGKTLAARLLHQRGARAARPFVTVDAASAARDRLRATLGGPAAGDGARGGSLARAAGGTLLIAGLDALPAAVAARLLRRLVRRAARADVRLITTACTAADAVPPWAPPAGRRATATVAVPPLAARRDDFPALIDHFAGLEATGRQRPQFDASAIAYLRRQPWPGNVRELHHFVARAAVLHPGAILDDARCAVLLHGERRALDRWLATAAEPLPMPNRRRPPPLVAADEVRDLQALLSDFDRACLRDAFTPPPPAWSVAAVVRLLERRRFDRGERRRQVA